MRISCRFVIAIFVLLFAAGDILNSKFAGAASEVTFDVEDLSQTRYMGTTVRARREGNFFQVVPSPLGGSDPVSYADGIRLDSGSGVQRIDAFSNCAEITNTSGNAVFVPVYKRSEWDSFRANGSAGVSRTSCGSVCVGNVMHISLGVADSDIERDCGIMGCSNGACNECLFDAQCTGAPNNRVNTECSTVSDPNVCVCANNYANCSGTCANTTIDMNNCGGCGIKCGVNQTCSGGSCVCSQSYYADCNGNPLDGCEVDTRSNNLNCGSCGNSCASGTCSDSACSCVGMIMDVVGLGTMRLRSTLSGFSTNGECGVGTNGAPVYNCFNAVFSYVSGACVNDPP